MLSHLFIRMFKCFDALEIELKPLTLLTGFNGAGKSSAIQPLLLLAQALQDKDLSAPIALNGPMVRLGTAGDVFKEDAKSIGFKISSHEDSINWSLFAQSGARELDGPHEIYPKTEKSDVVETLETLSFISAVRYVGDDSFPIPDRDTQEHASVGHDGRYASYWYNELCDGEVVTSMQHPNEKVPIFRRQLDAYLSDLFPGAQANVQSVPLLSRLALQFRLSAYGEWRKPSNIGYGLTYCFPILVSLLTAKAGQTIVVDSPEAHLHPSAQSKMGEILARFASAGIQVIIETHSDHLLNGARLAAAKGQISSSDIAIHFFSGARGEDNGVASLTVSTSGEVNDWPTGFFDQQTRDLGELFKTRRMSSRDQE